MEISAYQIAERFIGLREVAGQVDSPQVMAMLRLDASWPESDEVPWCSAFVNYVAWLLRLPRSKSLAARSWLGVGMAIEFPQVGNDVVVLSRGSNPASGHVGFYAGRQGKEIFLLGGNQGNAVNVSAFPEDRVLGYRRLWEAPRNG